MMKATAAGPVWSPIKEEDRQPETLNVYSNTYVQPLLVKTHATHTDVDSLLPGSIDMDYTRQLVIFLLCLGAVLGEEPFLATDCC